MLLTIRAIYRPRIRVIVQLAGITVSPWSGCSTIEAYEAI